MKRRVIKQGHNTFTITLPTKWATRQNITPGMELEVFEQGNSLLVNPSISDAGSSRTEVDITGLPNPLLWRFVSAAYRAGYNEIKINFEGIEDDEEKLSEFSYDITDWFYRGELPKERAPRLSAIEAIQALVNRFVGIEIIEQRPNYVVLKQFGEISYKEFDNALKRIFMVLTSMSQDILAAIEKGDRTQLKAVHMIDTNIDRFEDYCLRVLNVKGYEDYRKTPTIYATIFLLELVGDELKRIAQHVIKDKPEYGPGALAFFTDAIRQFELYHDIFYHFERKKVIKIFENEAELTAKALKLHANSTGDEKELLHHLKKITRHLVSLVELAIDLRADTALEQNHNQKAKD